MGGELWCLVFWGCQDGLGFASRFGFRVLGLVGLQDLGLLEILVLLREYLGLLGFECFRIPVGRWGVIRNLHLLAPNLRVCNPEPASAGSEFRCLERFRPFFGFLVSSLGSSNTWLNKGMLFLQILSSFGLCQIPAGGLEDPPPPCRHDKVRSKTRCIHIRSTPPRTHIIHNWSHPYTL